MSTRFLLPVLSVLALPVQAMADPAFHLFTETDPDYSPGGTTLIDFDSLADLEALNESSFHTYTANGGHPFGGAFSVRGLTYDGSQYHLLTESDPGYSPARLFLSSYDSLADLRALNYSSSFEYTANGGNPFGGAFSVGGLTYDGSQFLLFTESDPGYSPAATYLTRFATLADLKALTYSSYYEFTANGGHPFGGAFSVAGLAYDGNQYLLLTESDPEFSPAKLYLSRYDSLAELEALTYSSYHEFTANGGNPFGSARSVGGFTADLVAGSNSVPEPATSALFLLGLAGLAYARRRRAARP
ncbi:MAG: PEP-CTERM sorting domain-containing protein [Hyphomicrobiales bacterium]|nr:PEP-CTERM sorting domain-containing protein [Hyphomicrobiales bacterium]